MLVLQGGSLLQKGENIFDIDTFSSICLQYVWKSGGKRGGREGGGSLRNQEGGKGEGE